MRIDRRLTLLGVMLVILSTVMATQYATTKVGYSYTIVHPSEQDIRFIGCDNASDDGNRVLRVNGTNASNIGLKLNLGDWSINTNKTYAAAFGIVNEEAYAVNITHISITNYSGNYDYLQVWLHGNGSLRAEDDSTAVFMWNNGTQVSGSGTTAWRLARGDQNPGTMTTNISTLSAASTNLSTPWDATVGIQVRYCASTKGLNQNAVPIGTNGRTADNASDFVWVQVSMNIPEHGVAAGAHGGTIEINFKADPPYGEA